MTADTRTNNLAELSPEMREGVIRACRESCRVHRGGDESWLCVNRGHACFRCQDKARDALNG